MGLLTPSPVATSAPKRLANVRLEGIVSEDVRSVIMLRDVFQVRKHIRRARVHQPTQGGSVNRLGVKPRGTRLVFSVELSYGSCLQLLFELFKDRIFFQMRLRVISIGLKESFDFVFKFRIAELTAGISFLEC